MIEYNKRIDILGLTGQIPKITKRSIRKAIAQKPTTFEKNRKLHENFARLMYSSGTVGEDLENEEE